MSLIILTVSLFAAVLRRLLGPVGIMLTVIIFLQFGNPSSGGSNGAVYLTNFWRDVGPFLPPRNAYELLRNTVYFGGNGIGQALGVLRRLRRRHRCHPDVPELVPDTRTGGPGPARPHRGGRSGGLGARRPLAITRARPTCGVGAQLVHDL